MKKIIYLLSILFTLNLSITCQQNTEVLRLLCPSIDTTLEEILSIYNNLKNSQNITSKRNASYQLENSIELLKKMYEIKNCIIASEEKKPFYMINEISKYLSVYPCISEATNTPKNVCLYSGEKIPLLRITDENITEILPYNEGFIPAKALNKKWGFLKINITTDDIYKCHGKCLNIDTDKLFAFKINPIYEEVKGFNSFLAGVKLNGKWGFINQEGKMIIEPQYEDVKSFYINLAAVKLNGKWGFINKKGEKVIDFKYDDAFSFTPLSSIENTAAVKLGKKWGFIDEEGKTKINFKYDEAYPFLEGRALVKKSNKWYAIDKDDKIITQLKYEDIKIFEGGIFVVKQNGKWGILKGGDAEFKYDSFEKIEDGYLIFKSGSKKIKVDRFGNEISID